MTQPLVLLLGNPNSGKTTLFNALTGLSARVGNYPGITVEHREGEVDLGATKARLLDMPGTYSLMPRSDDEALAVRGVFGLLPGTPRPDLIVLVVDASALERNLFLAAQLRELPLPVVLALTMTDTLAKDGRDVDVELLQRRIGVPVVKAPGVAKGADALRALLAAQLRTQTATTALNVPRVAGDDVMAAEGATHAARLALPGAERALGALVLQARVTGMIDKLPFSVPRRAPVRVHGDRPDAVVVGDLIGARYARVSAWVDGVIKPLTAGDKAVARSVRMTHAVDAIALHKVAGPILLVGVFFTLFMALFSWSAPVMDGVQGLVSIAGTWAVRIIPSSMPLVQSLVKDGIFAGVGNVVVFVPQIAILFLFLAILEDTGYLARAAFLLDRLMARTGLHGRAFVPMLSGFACAVPAIMATRTIESHKDRIVTILVTPLISCSARLPVYALMIATVFAAKPPIAGVVPVGAVVMISMYALSIAAALVMAAVFKRTLLKSPTPALVLELPPYRRPKLGSVSRAVLSRVRVFLVEAGTTILAITIILWGLFTFPRDDDAVMRHQAARAAVTAHAGADEAATADALAAVDARFGQEQVQRSIAGRFGHLLEPVIAPLGFDWKLGVGLVASFAAREVLVSTLGIVYGIGDGADESNTSLQDAIRADKRADGTPLYSPLTALSLLVFFVLAMQCMSTLAAVKRETGGWKWPLVQFGYMSVLAYTASLLVYQGGQLLGFT